MAKAKREIEEFRIETADQADHQLAAIADLRDFVAAQEILARDKISSIEAALVKDAAPARAQITEFEEMIEAWAKANRAEIFPEGKKSLELTRGTIGFRLPKGKIKLVLAVENIVARLKAKKFFECIRLTEEPDLLQLVNYDDAQLEELGLKRTHPKDKFFYELKKTEVKP